MSHSNSFYICQVGKKADLYNTETTVAVRAHTHIIRRTNGRGHLRQVEIRHRPGCQPQVGCSHIVLCSTLPWNLPLQQLVTKGWGSSTGTLPYMEMDMYICDLCTYKSMHLYKRDKPDLWTNNKAFGRGKHQNWNVSTERQQDVQ